LHAAVPELPEVETVVRTLRPRLVGRTIARVDLRRPDIVRSGETDLPRRLLSRTVIGITRRGKKILIQLDDATICIHLGMTGRLTTEPVSAPLLPHTHMIWRLHDAAGKPLDEELRFRDPRRFGGVWCLSCCADAEANLGPEPLLVRAPQLADKLARTKRPIKSALLDQRLLAGLGNIYVDEALHVAKIHPLSLTCDLTRERVADLTRAIKQVLRRAIRHRGSTLRDYVDADGKAGGFQRLHRVYDRKGEPCPRCKTPIDRIVISGRSTHYCPACQPKHPSATM
jgi:formamidopyrimidine-DNA glycosylase